MTTTHDFDCSSFATECGKYAAAARAIAKTNIVLSAEMRNRAVEQSIAQFVATAAKDVYTPKRILRSGRATIVFWKDGTKTVVKRTPDEPDNEYAAFTAALAIKVFGSNSKVKRVIQNKTEEQE